MSRESYLASYSGSSDGQTPAPLHFEGAPDHQSRANPEHFHRQAADSIYETSKYRAAPLSEQKNSSRQVSQHQFPKYEETLDQHRRTALTEQHILRYGNTKSSSDVESEISREEKTLQEIALAPSPSSNKEVVKDSKHRNKAKKFQNEGSLKRAIHSVYKPIRALFSKKPIPETPVECATRRWLSISHQFSQSSGFRKEFICADDILAETRERFQRANTNGATSASRKKRVHGSEL